MVKKKNKEESDDDVDDKKVSNEDLKKFKDFNNKNIPANKRKQYEEEFKAKKDTILKQELYVSDQKAKELADSIQITQYDHSKVPLDASILVVGKRRYGKSTWTYHLLSKMWKYYPGGGYCFTRTKFNYFWHQCFPAERIYEGMDWDVVLKILEEQKRKWDDIIYRHYESSDEEFDPDKVDEKIKPPYIVIVLDDIISNKHDMRYEELLLELMFSGRHYKITIIINSQDIKGLSPDTRQNFDIIVCTYQTQERQISTLKDDYGDFYPNNKVFREVIKKNTQNYQVLIIDQTTAKFDVSEVFFVDTADLKPEPFHIGNLKFWKESKCNWKKQLKLYKNIPTYDKEQWGKLAELEWKKDEEMIRNGEFSWEDEEDEEKEFRIYSNDPFFADEKTKARLEEEERKKMPMSNSQIAQKQIDEAVFYRPANTEHVKLNFDRPLYFKDIFYHNKYNLNNFKF